jgi:hypothetical protein
MAPHEFLACPPQHRRDAEALMLFGNIRREQHLHQQLA